MKKMYLVLAAAIMGISFSAFTSTGADAGSGSNTLYWYPVTQATNQINSAAPIPGSPMTQAQLRNADLLPCVEGTSSDCVRGFTLAQSSNHSSAGLESIKRAN